MAERRSPIWRQLAQLPAIQRPRMGPRRTGPVLVLAVPIPGALSDSYSSCVAMPLGHLEWTFFWAGVAVLGVLVMTIALDRYEVSASPAKSTPTAQANARPAALPKRPVAPPPKQKSKPTPQPTPREPRPVVSPKKASPAFVLSATRGDSWLSIRAGSSTGRVLYEGLLTRGRILRYRAPRLWVRFGAAANVDVRVGQRKTRLPFGTADVLLDRSGRAQLQP